MSALAQATLDYLYGKTRALARRGGFVRAFSLPYRDSAPMVTVGGVLPPPIATEDVRHLVGRADWPGISTRPIETAPLTQLEVTRLRSLLPATSITREQVRDMGFDLDEEQIEFFCKHYLRFPVFVQALR